MSVFWSKTVFFRYFLTSTVHQLMFIFDQFEPILVVFDQFSSNFTQKHSFLVKFGSNWRYFCLKKYISRYLYSKFISNFDENRPIFINFYSFLTKISLFWLKIAHFWVFLSNFWCFFMIYCTSRNCWFSTNLSPKWAYFGQI